MFSMKQCARPVPLHTRKRPVKPEKFSGRGELTHPNYTIPIKKMQTLPANLLAPAANFVKFPKEPPAVSGQRGGERAETRERLENFSRAYAAETDPVEQFT